MDRKPRAAADRTAPLESALARVIGLAGVLGVGAALGAILGAADTASWVIGLVVAAVSLVLAFVLFRLFPTRRQPSAEAS